MNGEHERQYYSREAWCRVEATTVDVIEGKWMQRGGKVEQRNLLDGRVNCSGTTYAITGGYSGLGLRTAHALSMCGGSVYLLSHNVKKGEAIALWLRRTTHNANVFNLGMDLNDFKSVRRAVLVLMDETPKVDALICNAGIGFSMPGQRTYDGFDPVYQTNFLGHALLTELMKPLLEATSAEAARVIMVSSILGWNALFWMTRGLNGTDSHPDGLDKYARGELPWPEAQYDVSKLSLSMYAKGLAERERNKKIRVFSAFPGTTTTSMTRMLSQGMLDNYCNKPVVQPLPCPKSVGAGAATTVFLATQPIAALESYTGDGFWFCTPGLSGLSYDLASSFTYKLYDTTMRWIGMATPPHPVDETPRGWTPPPEFSVQQARAGVDAAATAQSPAFLLGVVAAFGVLAWRRVKNARGKTAEGVDLF
jgi:retinol dehydrogenase-12